MTLIGNVVNLARRVVNALGLDLDTGFQRVEYDDVFPGSSWEVPLGATEPNVVSVTIESLPLRLRSFAGTGAAETMSNSWEIVHGAAMDALNAGTIKAEAHVHGCASTVDAGTVVMQISAILRSKDVAPVSLGTVRCVFDIPASHQYFMMISGAEFTKPAGGFHIGDIINFNVFRNPADAADNYEADFLFDQAALHLPFDSRGSRQRYIK